MIINVDIDGVIADLVSELSWRYGEAGIEVEYEKCFNFKMERNYDEPYEGWIRDQLDDPTFWLNIKPHNDAWYVLNKWFHHHEHEINFITARWDYDLTYKWLNEWGVPFDRLEVGVPTGEKHTFATKYKADIVVEDRPEEIMAYEANEVPCIVPSRPWNKEIYESQHVFTVSDMFHADEIVNS